MDLPKRFDSDERQSSSDEMPIVTPTLPRRYLFNRNTNGSSSLGKKNRFDEIFGCVKYRDHQTKPIFPAAHFKISSDEITSDDDLPIVTPTLPRRSFFNKNTNRSSSRGLKNRLAKYFASVKDMDDMMEHQPENMVPNKTLPNPTKVELEGGNTRVSKTEMIKSTILQPITAPVRESKDFSDGNTNSGAEGSGSHRTAKKTLRRRRNFTSLKSLRTLVMGKLAKRQTQHDDVASVTSKFPQANSTQLPGMSNRCDDNHDCDENEVSNHEVSTHEGTLDTSLELCLENIRKKNMEDRLKVEEVVPNILNTRIQEPIFKVPAKTTFARRPKTTIPKRTRFTPFTEELPGEIIEDMKYKPTKRFHLSDAGWITKRLYKYLETKLAARYDNKARVLAERLVENIYKFTKEVRRNKVAPKDSVDKLKREMARLHIVQTHFEFYNFFNEFMPRMIRVKVIPDAVNNIPVPSNGVFSNILP